MASTRVVLRIPVWNQTQDTLWHAWPRISRVSSVPLPRISCVSPVPLPSFTCSARKYFHTIFETSACQSYYFKALVLFWNIWLSKKSVQQAPETKRMEQAVTFTIPYVKRYLESCAPRLFPVPYICIVVKPERLVLRICIYTHAFIDICILHE